MLTPNGDVANNHISDWIAFDWILAWGVLALAIVSVGLAVYVIRATIISDEAALTWFVVGAAVGVVGFFGLGFFLWGIARHMTEFRWVALTVVLAVALTSVASYRGYHAAGDPGRYSPYQGREHEKWTIGTPAAISAAIAVGVAVSDGVTRIAAAIPMAAGAFAGLLVLAIIAFFIWAFVS